MKWERGKEKDSRQRRHRWVQVAARPTPLETRSHSSRSWRNTSLTVSRPTPGHNLSISEIVNRMAWPKATSRTCLGFELRPGLIRPTRSRPTRASMRSRNDGSISIAQWRAWTTRIAARHDHLITSGLRNTGCFTPRSPPVWRVKPGSGVHHLVVVHARKSAQIAGSTP